MSRNLRRSSSLFVWIALFATLLSFGASAQETAAPEREKRDIVRQRSEWFYGQRAYPHKRVPSGARLRALQQLHKKLAGEAQTRARAGAAAQSNPSWTSIGPQPIDTPYTDTMDSGRVTALAINPGNISQVYAAGAQGGIWKTTNGGTTWAPLTDTQPSLAVGSLTLDPTNSSTIYVGTGEENFSGDSYYGAGILKSTDGGNTWTHICGPFCGPWDQDGYYGGGARIGGLVVDPNNNQVLLAALESNNNGIYRSADGGNTWTQVLSGNCGTAVLFDPVNTGVAYAALGNSFSGYTEGVYKSTDSGQTWTPINGTGANVLPLANAARIVLAMAPSSTTTLFAGIANINDGSLLGFFETTDGGANWVQLTSTPDYCNPQCSYDNVIAVQPTNANVIYAGGAYTTTLQRSLDGGHTWSVLQSSQQDGILHADMHALAFSPDGNTLYVGNDGGVYSTTQVTASNPTFVNLNSTLALTQMYPGLSINPANVANSIGGSQDNGTILYDGSSTWNYATCGDGGYTAIDPAIPSTMYAACEVIDVEKSTSSGAFGTWNSAQNGIDTSDRVDFIPPMVMDPSASSTLYFGTYRIYQTTDAAGAWTAISPDLTDGSGFWAVITSIAVAPTDSNTVYAGTGDSNVQVTTNASTGAGATWTKINSGLPSRVLTQVAVNPTTSTTAYATFTGFTGFGDSLGHVFQTTNGGTSWTDISSDLPDTPVNAIVVDPDVPSTIFVGTDIGVFYTTTGGASWTSLVNGLPTVAVLGLTLHDASRTLRASTHGRGLWDINIAAIVPTVSITSISPSSAIVGGPTFTLTVNGVNFDTTSVAQWNSANLSTTFVNTGQLTATAPAIDIAVAGTFPVTVFNSSSSQTSNPGTFTVNNPVPSIASLAPNSATAGGPAFTLTVNGGNFVAGAQVLWNGSAQTTTFVNAGQVTAAITASDIATAGSAQVSVSNPAPGGGTSGALSFAINNPVPLLTTLSPKEKAVGGPSFKLTVKGSSFVKGAVIQWNGVNQTTKFTSSTDVSATIGAADIAKPGTVPATVTNPAPGGGVSNALTFTIGNPKPVLKSLSPSSATHGGPAFTLTVNGSDFLTSSVVKWKGSARTTTYVSATELQAAITAHDIAKAGSAAVTVANPAPGGGNSNPLTFTIK